MPGIPFSIPYSLAPIFITAILLLIIFGVAVFVSSQTRKAKEIEKQFIEQLEAASGLTNNTLNTLKKTKKNTNFLGAWDKYWGRTLKYSGLLPANWSDSQVGMLVILVVGIIYGIITLLAKNFGLGLVPLGTALYLLTFICNNKIKAKEKIFEDQIPPFLATIKANIQANETPERALINAIETSSDPLRSEVWIAKSLTESGTFKSAITQLRKQTKNETLQFLCSCIELSTQVGANLEHQIVTIEAILESNRALKRKLDLAINENKPLVLVSSLILPFIFMFMYIANQQTRDFWFKSPTAWIVFGLVILIFAAGLFISNRIIDKTSKF